MERILIFPRAGYKLIATAINSLVDSLHAVIFILPKETITSTTSKPVTVASPEQVILTPMDEAVSEIRSRRKDKDLVAKVEEYLNGDIPKHFNRANPIFYLSRHLATPNYELLHVMALTEPQPYDVVVGQDVGGKFVSNNDLKRPLGKLPVVKKLSKTEDEIIEYFTIVNFAEAQSKKFRDIKTVTGETLEEFHHGLFKYVFPVIPEVGDETEWVDRNHRNDIMTQYKKMLALLCVHGIMLESYTPADYKFLEDIVKPTFFEIESVLGVRPLIVEHIPEELEVTRDWNSYPPAVYQYLKQKLTN